MHDCIEAQIETNINIGTNKSFHIQLKRVLRH